MGFFNNVRSLLRRNNQRTQNNPFAVPSADLPNEDILRALVASEQIGKEDIQLCGEILLLLRRLPVARHDRYIGLQKKDVGTFVGLLKETKILLLRLREHEMRVKALARSVDESLTKIRGKRSPNPNMSLLSSADRKIFAFNAELSAKLGQLLRDIDVLLRDAEKYVYRASQPNPASPSVVQLPNAQIGFDILKRIPEQVQGIASNLSNLYELEKAQKQLASQKSSFQFA